jgi:hypothetical protein
MVWRCDKVFIIRPQCLSTLLARRVTDLKRKVELSASRKGILAKSPLWKKEVSFNPLVFRGCTLNGIQFFVSVYKLYMVLCIIKSYALLDKRCLLPQFPAELGLVGGLGCKSYKSNREGGEWCVSRPELCSKVSVITAGVKTRKWPKIETSVESPLVGVSGKTRTSIGSVTTLGIKTRRLLINQITLVQN